MAEWGRESSVPMTELEWIKSGSDSTEQEKLLHWNLRSGLQLCVPYSRDNDGTGCLTAVWMAPNMFAHLGAQPLLRVFALVVDDIANWENQFIAEWQQTTAYQKFDSGMEYCTQGILGNWRTSTSTLLLCCHTCSGSADWVLVADLEALLYARVECSLAESGGCSYYAISIQHKCWLLAMVATFWWGWN